MTESEQIFEQWCTAQGIGCSRMPEGARRMPDYQIDLAGLSVLAEIKQIEPTEHEQWLVKQAREGSEFAFGFFGPERQATIDKRGTLGWRVRPAIVDAASQLREQAAPSQPGVIVLYNRSLPFLTDDTNMMAGMHGTLEWKGPMTADGEALLAEHLGGGRTLSAIHNRTVSGVWRLFDLGDHPGVDVFHNCYAANPIDPEALRGFVLAQWTMRERTGAFPEWVEV